MITPRRTEDGILSMNLASARHTPKPILSRKPETSRTDAEMNVSMKPKRSRAPLPTGPEMEARFAGPWSAQRTLLLSINLGSWCDIRKLMPYRELRQDMPSEDVGMAPRGIILSTNPASGMNTQSSC